MSVDTRLGVYPFGEPLGLVRWLVTGTRRVFILGVYPSAFHASWRSPDGRVISPALAVADEPEPFWDGSGHEALLARVAERVPAGAGSLHGAGAHNGRAGRTLNESYLGPLGLERDNVWIADLQNYYLASDGQIRRIEESYEPLVKAGLVPPTTIVSRASRPRIDQLAGDREPPLQAELAESAPTWLITLGDEPVGVLGLQDLRNGDYGQPRHATVFGRDVHHLALVHTRQAGKHGRYSPQWHERHHRWLQQLHESPPAWLDDLNS
jgi:hypothetical protein